MAGCRLTMAETSVEAAVALDSDGPFAVRTLYLREPTANELRVRIVATSICKKP